MTIEDPLTAFDNASDNGPIDTAFDEDYMTALANDPRSTNGHAKTNGKPQPQVESPALPEIYTLDQLLASTDPPYDWLVPGLIERGDRLILTGLAGKGKSTLFRQMGAQLAAGIHPFGGEPFDPLRVLIVDCENSRRQVRRKVDRLRDAAGRGDLLQFVFRPDGLKLNVDQSAAWLERLVDAARPEILVIGPVYKMASGNPKDEEPAKAVAECLDYLRTTYGFGLMMEAHTPYADSTTKGAKRVERPYGASLWERWPEFGLFLSPDGHLRDWRGPRDERAWPKKLRRGDIWPWEVDEPADEPAEWHGPTECMDRLLDLLVAATPTEYTTNQLITAMTAHGYTYRRQTIYQAAEMLAAERRINVRSGARNARIYSWTSTLPGVDDEQF